MTTINEGDTLYLDCITLHASIKWFSPEGVVASNERILLIMNIQRSAAGIYTCAATNTIHGITRNSTVNVIVQCECHVYVIVQYEIICTCTKCDFEGGLEAKTICILG